VTVRLLEGCQSIAQHVTRATDARALRHHAAMINRSGQEGLPKEADRKDVADRYEGVMTTLSGK